MVVLPSMLLCNKYTAPRGRSNSSTRNSNSSNTTTETWKFLPSEHTSRYWWNVRYEWRNKLPFYSNRMTRLLLPDEYSPYFSGNIWTLDTEPGERTTYICRIALSNKCPGNALRLDIRPLNPGAKRPNTSSWKLLLLRYNSIANRWPNVWPLNSSLEERTT